MTDQLMIYYLLTLVVVIFTSIGHLLLKMATIRVAESGGRIYTHPLSLAGYGIFAFVALLSIYAMKGLDMKVFFALNSLTYICIPILAFLVLKESFTRNKVIGVIIISIGVLLFNL
jgi:drug/metabolite transporter (DMT)-like permease